VPLAALPSGTTQAVAFPSATATFSKAGLLPGKHPPVWRCETSSVAPPSAAAAQPWPLPASAPLKPSETEASLILTSSPSLGLELRTEWSTRTAASPAQKVSRVV
jgi:hypothetical protein